MAFRVGQKVVCVDDAPPSYFWSDGDMGGLKKGAIYEVRWVGMFDHPMLGSHLCIHVAGISRLAKGRDWPFNVNRFRPVVERKTDTGFAMLEKIRRAVSRELIT